MTAQAVTVDLWQVPVGDDAEIAPPAGLLTPDEEQRAAAFKHPADRLRFVCTRSALRQILGVELDRDPRMVALDYGRWGRPYVPGTSFDVNVTHDGDLAMIALSHAVRVGVDVAADRRDVSWDRIQNAILTDAEAATLTGQSPAERRSRIRRWWTAKEAWVKNLGCGIRRDLRTFTVEFSGDSATISDPDTAGGSGRVWMSRLGPYDAALAVQGEKAPECHVRLFTWSGA